VGETVWEGGGREAAGWWIDEVGEAGVWWKVGKPSVCWVGGVMVGREEVEDV